MLPNQIDKNTIQQNQNTTEAVMSEENVAIENKVHIQTMVNTDPDFLDGEEKPTLQELIEYYIMFQNNHFSDFTNSTEVQAAVKNIIYDSQDDKVGRIKDLYDAKIEEIAKDVITRYINGENTAAHWAGNIYNETMKRII
jgi:uncharacterized Zn finger protein